MAGRLDGARQVCEMCYGRIQGRARLIEHFRSSRLMRKKDKYRPLLFDTVRPPSCILAVQLLHPSSAAVQLPSCM